MVDAAEFLRAAHIEQGGIGIAQPRADIGAVGDRPVGDRPVGRPGVGEAAVRWPGVGLVLRGLHLFDEALLLQLRQVRMTVLDLQLIQ